MRSSSAIRISSSTCMSLSLKLSGRARIVCKAEIGREEGGDDEEDGERAWSVRLRSKATNASPAARRSIPEYFNPPGVHKDALSLRMHGRPLDSLRVPSERSPHRTARLRTLNAVPHRHTHLPLISALASLLSIDDKTFHLVTHSPAHSAMFPGPMYPSDEHIENAQEIHGVHALLSRYCALREGLAVACDESMLSFGLFISSECL